MTDSNIIDTVDSFKARAKELLVASKFRQAVEFANTKFESTAF